MGDLCNSRYTHNLFKEIILNKHYIKGKRDYANKPQFKIFLFLE